MILDFIPGETPCYFGSVDVCIHGHRSPLATNTNTSVVLRSQFSLLLIWYIFQLEPIRHQDRSHNKHDGRTEGQEQPEPLPVFVSSRYRIGTPQPESWTDIQKEPTPRKDAAGHPEEARTGSDKSGQKEPRQSHRI